MCKDKGEAEGVDFTPEIRAHWKIGGGEFGQGVMSEANGRSR